MVGEPEGYKPRFRDLYWPSGRDVAIFYGMSKEPSGTQKRLGDFAPKLAELTDRVLFGEVWERPELSKRDRSLVTVAALVALNRPDQLRSHLGRALENGVRKEELIEAITHLAFYAGWPCAMIAITIARELFSTEVSR